jgi:hypothetical protein
MKTAVVPAPVAPGVKTIARAFNQTSRKTAMIPADKMSPNVKKRMNVTKGLLPETPETFDEDVIFFPSVD